MSSSDESGVTADQLALSKLELVNVVSSNIIQEPRYGAKESEETEALMELMARVAQGDPEFILKLALYVRQSLNIRGTANFLLAAAAALPKCAPYVGKYFGAAVRLPSDWLDVAALSMVLPGRTLTGRALPASLRKAMTAKFPDFDTYQLSKYNNEGKLKRRARKKKLALEQGLEIKEDRYAFKPQLTMKQMIQLLHIKYPTGAIMRILGKKYPASYEAFLQSRLPGEFDKTMAGKRMKLPVAETWETVLSAKGNTALAWETLIDNRKLPFMAMMRNLRNMILTGISNRHHNWVLSRLTDERTIANCRQFPFAFFTAYEAIDLDLEELAVDVERAKALRDARTKGTEQPKMEPEELKRARKTKIPKRLPTPALIQRYKDALDQAVMHSTCNNVLPMKGSTLVLCSASAAMRAGVCKTARLGASINKTLQLGALLGLMCLHSCEVGEFLLYGGGEVAPVTITPGTVLHNMHAVVEEANQLPDSDVFPARFLDDMIRRRRHVDTVIVLADHWLPSAEHINTYRKEVNPELLYVSVNLGGGRGIQAGGSRDVFISGFSDAILRYVAARGEGRQLEEIEGIDQEFDLQDIPINLPAKKKKKKKRTKAQRLEAGEGTDAASHTSNALSILKARAQAGKWRTARVFVSSTFVDMAHERDVLVNHVFPILSERCRERRINFQYVDLRWGVTEHEAESGQSTAICLTEVQRCTPFFLGILGTRYGWVPESYDVPDAPEFDWIKDLPAGRSLTELECRQGGLLNVEQNCAHFYLRDPSNSQGQGDAWLTHDPEHRARLKALRQEIRDKVPASRVLDNYRDVDHFAQRVLADLWGSIERMFPEHYVQRTPLEEEAEAHNAVLQSHIHSFVGRTAALRVLSRFVQSNDAGPLLVSGPSGIGKSALLAHFSHSAHELRNTYVLSHFGGASQLSRDARFTLFRLCSELSTHFKLGVHVPSEYNDLKQLFPRILFQVSRLAEATQVQVVLVLDEVRGTLDWLPEEPPVRMIISSCDIAALNAARVRSLPELALEELTRSERENLVRTNLAHYRKRLDERPSNNQMKLLVQKSGAASPLYLALACAELRVFGVFEEVTAHIKQLPVSLKGLIAHAMQRLERAHGAELVRLTLAVITVSRGGILETQLREVLQVSDARWASLRSGLLPFLAPNDDTLRIFHPRVLLAVQQSYVDASAVLDAHRRLAALLQERYRDRYTLSELPYHLVHGEMDTSEVLGSLEFVLQKVSAGLTYDLLRDLQGGAQGSDFLDFVSQNAQLLAEFPHLGYQQARNQPASSAVARQALDCPASLKPPAWFEWLNKPQRNSPLRLSLSGYQEGITACSFSAQGDAMLCAFNDRTMRIFDPETGEERLTLVGHIAPVTSCSFSPDGRRVASASNDKSVRVWDALSGVCLMTLSGHKRRVCTVAWSSDGKQVASGGWDMLVLVWDLKTQKFSKTLRGHTKPVTCVSFSPDGKQLASSSWDHSIILWDVDAAKSTRKLHGHNTSVKTVQFSPSGYQLVSTSVDGCVCVFDVQTGQVMNRLRGHTASFSGDNKNLVTADDSVVRVYDALGGRPLSVIGSSTVLNSVHVSGNYVAAAAGDCTVILWENRSERLVRTLTQGHTRSVTCVRFTCDHKRLLSAGEDGVIAVWDHKRGVLKSTVLAHSDVIADIAAHPSDARIVASVGDMRVRVWDLKEGVALHTLEEHQSLVCGVAYSASGDTLASCGRDLAIYFYDARNAYTRTRVVRGLTQDWLNKIAFVGSSNTDVCVSTWDYNSYLVRANGTKTPFIGHMGNASSVAVSRDGKRVATAGFDGSVRLFDQRGTPLATMEGHGARVTSVCFSADDATLLSTSDDCTLRKWDAVAGTQLISLVAHHAKVRQVSFDPKEKQIVSAGDDGRINVWSSDWTPFSASQYLSRGIVDLSLHESTLAVAYRDQAHYFIYNVDSGELLQQVDDAHSVPVSAVAFSPDGRFIATGDESGMVCVCSANGGRVLEQYQAHSTTVSALRWDPMSPASLYSGSWDGEVTRGPFGGQQLLQMAGGHCDWVNEMRFVGNTLYTVSHDGSATAWTAKTLRVNFRLESIHNNWVLAMDRIGDDLLVTASYDGEVTVRSPSTAKVTLRLEGHAGRVNGVVYVPKSRAIVTACADLWLRAFCETDGHLLTQMRLSAPVVSLVTTGERVVAGTSVGQVLLLSVARE